MNMKIIKIAKFGDSVRQKYINQNFPEQIVDSYIAQFDTLRKRKDKEMYAPIPNLNVPINRRHDIQAYTYFYDLERVVDYVKGQKQVIDNTQATTSQVAPIYQNENVSIYRANNSQEARDIKGDFRASWCIAAQGSNNMYDAYRYKQNEPTFYFVKNHKATPDDNYGFFVIQVDNTNNYIVTSARNDGDRHMSWEQITQINPNLKNLQSVFKNIPLTPQERDNYDKFRKGLNDNRFAHLSYEDKKMYLDTVGHRALSAGQFESLPDDLKSHYLSFGIGLDYFKYNIVKKNPKMMKRYQDVIDIKIDKINKQKPYKNIGWENIDTNTLPDTFLSPSELDAMDANKRIEVIKKLHPDQINNIVDHVDANSYDTNISKEVAIYSDNLTYSSILALVYSSPKPVEMIQLLAPKIKKVITNSYASLITKLIQVPETQEDMQKTIDALMPNIYILSEINMSTIFAKINDFDLLEPLINLMLTEKWGIDSSDIDVIMRYSKLPDVSAEKIIKLIKNVRNYEITTILMYADNKKYVAQLLGQDNINKLAEYDINTLIRPHFNPDGEMLEALKNHPIILQKQKREPVKQPELAKSTNWYKLSKRSK